MTKPSEQELAIALTEAAIMKEHDHDPKFIAKSLLNLNYRLHYLEKIFHLAERYVLFGQDEHEHQALVKAIEEARKQELRMDKQDNPNTFGL